MCGCVCSLCVRVVCVRVCQPPSQPISHPASQQARPSMPARSASRHRRAGIDEPACIDEPASTSRPVDAGSSMLPRLAATPFAWVEPPTLPFSKKDQQTLRTCLLANSPVLPGTRANYFKCCLMFLKQKATSNQSITSIPEPPSFPRTNSLANF